MKKILWMIITLVLFVISGCRENREKLYVYNWGDYIDPETIRMFEDEAGVRVIYQEFASNEDLYVKMKTTKEPIDVIFVSDYMLERMIRENLVQPIDKSAVKNIRYVDDEFMGKEFDPNNDYSSPYLWGTVGIVYNAEKYPEGIDSWSDLWDERYSRDIVIYNSQRDVMMMALKKLGYSMNTRSVDELEEAKAELIKQKPLIYAYLGDEINDVLANEDSNIGLVYNGDAKVIMGNNESFKYVLPKEGTNMWIDTMAIPTISRNTEYANKFIDFILRPDIAAMNANYLQYSTPETAAKEYLSEELTDNEALYPNETALKNTEVFRDPESVLKIYDKIWTEITSGL